MILDLEKKNLENKCKTVLMNGWLIRTQKSSGKCTCRSDMAEIISLMAFNKIQSFYEVLWALKIKIRPQRTLTVLLILTEKSYRVLLAKRSVEHNVEKII